ncbi:hypothetical protein D9756_011175 [Leucocoprinus leucothites]|uniref:Death domain-containing protein n=1 Tax=Leucocoprinus leucothites TaxID=201217 RepID=A0A8H5FQE4_9AGAR|nr:hypothetical protein D9756_011175 [Leucoagaricus leucothites]
MFVQKDHNPARFSIKEQPWARLIPEEDIDFEEIGPLDFRFGDGGAGKSVNVYKVWMSKDLAFLDRAMKAYRRLQDTNLTYDLIGHLIDEYGSLIGLVTEPMLGRAISLHDAPLVFSALQRLNSIGYILDTPYEGSMLITSSGELKITAMHNVILLPEDPQEREARIKKREEWCRKWVFGEMARKMQKGVAERPWCRVPGSTRGKFVVGVHVMAPLEEPEKILSLTSGQRNGGAGNSRQGEEKWMVEKFRDVWSQARAEDAMEIWRLVRAGGVKRLLEADSGDEEHGNEDRSLSPDRRPMKKLRGLDKGKGRARAETPLPPLPVVKEDYPVMPPSILDTQENGRERSSSQTLYERSSSPTAVGFSSPSPTRCSPVVAVKGIRAGNGIEMNKVPSWLLQGDWLELTSRSRFEIID